MSRIIYIVIPIICVVYINCMQVIPERVYLTYVNPKYARDAKINVRKYNRNSPYYVNIEGEIFHTWGNNVTLRCTFYEFLHNEYKPSFVELKFKLCTAINSDPYIGKSIANAGITCPIKPGRKVLRNMTVPNVENFPYKWPFEKGKAVIQLQTEPGHEMIGEGYGIVLFKQDEKKKKDEKLKA